jgi:nucleoid DNA-binding protein
MNEKIHYDDFVEEISQESGYDNETVRDYLSVMFETIVTESTKGNAVKLRNFGSFQPRWYKAKRGINPQTGQPLDILPHYHIHFASSKVLKNAINAEPSKPFLSKLILASLVVLLIAILFYFTTSKDEPKIAEAVKQVQQTPTVVTKTKEEDVRPVVEEVPEPEIIVEQQVQEVIQEPEVIAEKPLYPGSHTVAQNETLSTIGSKIYGTKIYWPLLYSANSSKVLNPDLILRGSTLVVPDKTKSKRLYSSYMDVHNAYMQRDNMSKSFWILCEGSQSLGTDFKMYLKNKLTPPDYAIIELCSPKSLK